MMTEQQLYNTLNQLGCDEAIYDFFGVRSDKIKQNKTIAQTVCIVLPLLRGSKRVTTATKNTN